MTKTESEGTMFLFVPGAKSLKAKRQLPEGGPVAQSVFKLALEGLDKLREKKYSDMEVMTAAISVAERCAGFSTGAMERIITMTKGW